MGAGEFRRELCDKIQTYKSAINYELHRTEIFTTSEFINNNVASLTNKEREARWPGWVQNFITACGTERDFLGLGIAGNFPAYNTMSDGTYMIRSFSNDVYLTLVGGTSVTTRKIAPPDKGKLHGRSTDATMQWTFEEMEEFAKDLANNLEYGVVFRDELTSLAFLRRMSQALLNSTSLYEDIVKDGD